MAPSSRYAVVALFSLALWITAHSVQGTMHCLVARPGYGLVSEKCPPNTVSCRIRVENDIVEYYEYSRLYDRNQFVCVLKNEFGTGESSGCIRKRSGRIRCWCFGRSNCNTPENSKLLYQTFVSGDTARFRKAVESIDFTDIITNEADALEIPKPFTNTPITAKSENAIRVTPTNVKESTTVRSTVIGKSTINMSSNSTPKVNVPLMTSTPMQLQQDAEKDAVKVEFIELLAKTDVPSLFAGSNIQIAKTALIQRGKNTSSAERPPGDHSRHRTHHHPHHHRNSFSREESTTVKPSTTTTTKPSTVKLTTTSATPLRSEWDHRHRVHIIHVSANDHYHKLEDLLSSSEFTDILDKESQELNKKKNRASDGRSDNHNETRLRPPYPKSKANIQDKSEEEYESDEEGWDDEKEYGSVTVDKSGASSTKPLIHTHALKGKEKAWNLSKLKMKIGQTPKGRLDGGENRESVERISGGYRKKDVEARVEISERRGRHNARDDAAAIADATEEELEDGLTEEFFDTAFYAHSSAVRQQIHTAIEMILVLIFCLMTLM